jgi:RNA polymerase sigma-70 factor (ECF subfamily)
VALTERGIPALGVDISRSAVARVRQAGAAALHGSVFDPLPGQGRWAIVLLADGNIGISGLPSRLLHRCARLLAPGGRILIEAEPGNVDEQLTAWLEHPDGRRGPDFPWARMGTDALLRAAADAGLHVTGQWRHANRVFACAAARAPATRRRWAARDESAPSVRDKRLDSSERTGLTLPGHRHLAGLAGQPGGWAEATEMPGNPAASDDSSAEWLSALTGTGVAREAGLARLHGLLVRVAARELRRREASAGFAGRELDDLAHQAADDAMLAILGKLDSFRGESRFTTWAYRFVVLEVSSKLGRHYWRQHPAVHLEAEDWDRLPDRLGADPGELAGQAELVKAVRHAVDETLTEHQRRLFVAVVLNGVPLDAPAARFGTNRNAIYKAIFDARRYPGVAAHLAACGPCCEVTGNRAARRIRHGRACRTDRPRLRGRSGRVARCPSALR